MQPVDFTTLLAVCGELKSHWIPARCEQVFQVDRTTLTIALRTLRGRDWLTIAWHPQAARLHIGSPPPRTPDTFTFSQQLKHQLNGLALVDIAPIAPWERVLELQFANRPGDPTQWRVYVEIMGKYSNVILANAQGQIVTAAHQVNEQQSRVRPILTGDPYEPPPAITGPLPRLEESQADWQERVALIPGAVKKQLLRSYGGLSSALVLTLLREADIDPTASTQTLTPSQWDCLYRAWRRWLMQLQQRDFQPGWTASGYTVLGWEATASAESVQSLLRDYYTHQLNVQVFGQLKHQLFQKLQSLLKKLHQKANTFRDRLEQSAQAEVWRRQADLLMAYAHQWRPGMTSITLADFETGDAVEISLEPEKNAIQNAQKRYKQHGKLKRAKTAVQPLLEAVQAEISYLEQVDAALSQITDYETPEDLEAIADIRDELIQQGYLEPPQYRPNRNSENTQQFYRTYTPNGLPVWIGRNNRQNDQLISQVATDYDLWFHTQEIPGSHVLLRLEAGQAPSDEDLQYTADLAAFFSRAREADQVPVIYTRPKYVYKPKGARPGMVLYKQEKVLWGQPQQLRLNPIRRRLEPAPA